MNEYWNDPPEPAEPPMCCDEYMEGDENELRCKKCGKTLTYPVEEDEPPHKVTEDIEPPPLPAKCPHGNEWGECDRCDYLSDLAYDAQRENRWR